VTLSDHTRTADTSLDGVSAGDPRLNDEYVRRVQLGSHTVVLVSVIHDHPTSSYRVRAVVDAFEPDVVAVELPNLLVPALASWDETDTTGGEMAAAIRSAIPSPAVGIDVPGRHLYRALRSEQRRQQPGLRTLLRTARSFGQIAVHAALGRLSHQLGAYGVPWMPSVADLEDEHSYGLGDDASPAEQAENEGAHLLRSETMLRTLDPPAATKFIDGVRERFMADRLRQLRDADVVVGVVGYSHLDSVAKNCRSNLGETDPGTA